MMTTLRYRKKKKFFFLLPETTIDEVDEATYPSYHCSVPLLMGKDNQRKFVALSSCSHLLLLHLHNPMAPKGWKGNKTRWIPKQKKKSYMYRKVENQILNLQKLNGLWLIIHSIGTWIKNKLCKKKRVSTLNLRDRQACTQVDTGVKNNFN